MVVCFYIYITLGDSFLKQLAFSLTLKFNLADLVLTPEQRQSYALAEIESLLQCSGKS
jgi:hypothetical protein